MAAVAALVLALVCPARAVPVEVQATMGSIFDPAAAGTVDLGDQSFTTGNVTGSLVFNTDTGLYSTDNGTTWSATEANYGLSESGNVQMGLFVFNSLSIGSGVTVQVQGNRGLVLASRGDLILGADLDIAGSPGSASSAGVGGPGAEGAARAQPTDSDPPGPTAGNGGAPGNNDGRGRGAGSGHARGYNCRAPSAGYGTSGDGGHNSTPGGIAYGDNLLVDLYGGSGGGGAYEDSNTKAGGGGGGGSLALIARGSLELDGTIDAYGGDGGLDLEGGGSENAAGGGGSGGGVLLAGGTVAFGASADINAYGGYVNWSGNYAVGGGGRVAVYVGAFGTGTQVARSGRTVTAAEPDSLSGLTVTGASNPVDMEHPSMSRPGTFYVVENPDPGVTYAYHVRADGPIAWWRLNDANNSLTAYDEQWRQDGEYYLDREDPPTPGGASPGASLLLTDPANASASFDGGTGLFVPNQGVINTNGPWVEKTLEMWFQADSTSGLQVLYEQGGGSRGLNLFIQDGDLVFGAWNVLDDDSGLTTPWNIGGNPWGEITTPILAGVPYHAVLVMDGDSSGKNGELLAYLDGELVGTLSGVGPLFNHGGQIGIGYSPDSTLINGISDSEAHYFTGLIDEVALYNRALDETEVSMHFEAATKAPLIPEPGSLGLFGLAVLVSSRWRSRR
jgi:hypothetical protein